MILRIRSIFPAQSAVRLPEISMPVVDTNTLREAALRASWRRDHNVARRRLALRWVLWWIWKYKLALLAAFMLSLGAVYVAYREGLLSPWITQLGSTNQAVDSGVVLRLDTQLQPRSAVLPSATPAPLDPPAPIQLKPEIQLKIKESSP
jgi:hypothetical protein